MAWAACCDGPRRLWCWAWLGSCINTKNFSVLNMGRWLFLQQSTAAAVTRAADEQGEDGGKVEDGRGGFCTRAILNQRTSKRDRQDSNLQPPVPKTI